MIRELKKAFNGLLDELDWMDDNTKKLAREKVAHFILCSRIFDKIL